jgi:hypothetical protein
VRPAPGQERRDGDPVMPVFVFVVIFLFTAGLHGARIWAIQRRKTRSPAGLLFSLSRRMSNKAVCGVGLWLPCLRSSNVHTQLLVVATVCPIRRTYLCSCGLLRTM